MYQSNKQKNFIKKIKLKKFIIFSIQVLIVAIFLTAWELLSKNGIINSFIYSSPSRIFDTIKSLINSGNLWIHIFTTLKEVIIAFILGISLGLFIATIFYLVPLLAQIFDPFLTILNSLPKVALGPIIIIIFGANTKSIIMMAILINLIVSITTIYNGFTSIDKTKVKLFKIYKASKFQTLTKLVFPSAYSSVITSLKLNISLTLIGVITGEFLVSQKGIGYLIIYGTQVFNLDLVMSGIIILLVISYLIYEIVVIVENKLLKNTN